MTDWSIWQINGEWFLDSEIQEELLIEEPTYSAAIVVGYVKRFLGTDQKNPLQTQPVEYYLDKEEAGEKGNTSKVDKQAEVDKSASVQPETTR